MERAGAAVAETVLRQFPGRVTVVCGKGNNGGDGKVCARVLREAGREVTVVEGVGDLGDPDVVVDALLGIGLREAPREDAARMIELHQCGRTPRRRRRRSVGGQRLDRRGAGRGGARDDDRHVRRREGRPRDLARARPCGQRASSRRSGSGRARTSMRSCLHRRCSRFRASRPTRRSTAPARC